MDKEFTDLTLTFPMDEDNLEDTRLEDFEVTLRIHESVTPEPQMIHLGDDDALPHIAVTPMTPPSGSVTPDDVHSTVSLTSPCGSPFKYQLKDIGAMGDNQNTNQNWRSGSPLPPQTDVDAKDFFAYRDSIIDNVISEVHEVTTQSDGNIKGTWLLTEIDSWNHEWERIVVLCEKVLVIIKYDFIGMKIEDTRRLELAVVDKIIQGELAYPQNSLTPKLNGIAEGIAGVVKECILPTVHGTVQTVGCAVWRKNRCTNPNLEEGVEVTEESTGTLQQKCPTPPEGQDINGIRAKGSIMSALSLDKFESKSRKAQGVQMIWNENQPLSFHQKWNPFDKSIPRVTFTSHPLFWHKGGGGSVSFFDIDPFCRELIYALGQGADDLSPSVRIEYKPIVIESYVGIASLLHNANSLGFYKVRGKVSF